MPLHQDPPFNVDDLLNLRAIEGSRVEFKPDFNELNEYQVLRTAVAFANDLLNLNGGYIVSGVEETRALLKKRGGDFQGAHRLFAEAFNVQKQDPKLLHEFAQTKMRLSEAQESRSPRGRETRRRLAREAADLLRSAIQLSDSDPAMSGCFASWVRRPAFGG
jgi:hypothetical protein